MSQNEATDDNVEMADAGVAHNGANGTSAIPDKDGEEHNDSTSMAAPEIPAQRTLYSVYLKSRIVEITVGPSEADHGALNIHQDLLIQSPYFADRISKLGPGDPSKIHLPDEDPATVESFLEFLYTKEYFPRLIANSARKRLEADEDIPNFDDTGAQLLRHAKVYTIAKKFGIEELCQLAFAKIHLVDSSPSAEIAYARYVYQSTSSDDATIRSPVKFYWASQSHELRHEVQKEFRQMCLDFPEFGFDVLTLVLDQKEKQKPLHHTTPSQQGRKRIRTSETPRG